MNTELPNGHSKHSWVAVALVAVRRVKAESVTSYIVPKRKKEKISREKIERGFAEASAMFRPTAGID